METLLPSVRKVFVSHLFHVRLLWSTLSIFMWYYLDHPLTSLNHIPTKVPGPTVL